MVISTPLPLLTFLIGIKKVFGVIITFILLEENYMDMILAKKQSPELINRDSGFVMEISDQYIAAWRLTPLSELMLF